MKKYIPQVFIVMVVLYLLFLIRPAFLGQLGGTFKPHSVPPEYVRFERFLDAQSQFSRTLWVPTAQRFGFYSYQHPAISADDFFHIASLSEATLELRQQTTENILQNAGVKYVIVPYDSEGEIFLKDRRYDNVLYLQTIKSLNTISWLKKLPGFGKIAVFEVPNPKDHFSLLGSGNVTYAFINPTEYMVMLGKAIKGERLVFAESYDKYWRAWVGGSMIQSEPYDGLFNSFLLPRGGAYTITVSYTPQTWVNIGLWISSITLVALCMYFISYFIHRFVK